MRRVKTGRKSGQERKTSRLHAWLHGSGAKCTLIVLLGTLVLLAMFCAASAPKRYSLTVGAVAHQTITATKDVEDTIGTEARRAAAASNVEPTYHLQEGASEQVLNNLDNLFRELRVIPQYGLTLRDENESPTFLRTKTFTDEELRYAQEQVTIVNLTRYQATILLRTELDSFDDMVTTVRQAVEGSLNTTIREGQVPQAISSIKQVVGYRVDTPLMQNIVPMVLNNCIQPNMVIEKEKTEQARQEARDQMEPVVYLQGQYIVREGDVVTENQVAMLETLGLLDTAHYDFSIYGGAALLILLAMLVLLLLLHMLAPYALGDVRSVSVIMLVLIVSEGIGIIAVKLVNVYLAPLALGAMLLTGLLGARVGLTSSFTLALLIAGLTAGGNNTYTAEMVHLLVSGMTGGVVSAQFLKGKPQRVRTVICGVLVAAINMVVLLAIGLMTSADLRSTMQNGAWSMAGGVISGLIAVGLQPVFEAAFNLATPSKLLELANPNQPLLRRLLLEAPGTYHHSIVVANLAEAAAERIGANPLLARTGAYFHDIGKLKRPLYFKENQMGENPHDHTNPYVSASIVTAHTRDGLQMAQKYHLPPEIQRIIVEHHGDTPVMYFYHKALQQADGKPVDVNSFRYDGERPATKESAIVMLADTTEAAVRSMPDPTPQAIERFIERLLRGKIEDGQLSNSPLSLRDIDGICEAFCKVLNGVFHERIEYPNVQVPARPLVDVSKMVPAEESTESPAAKADDVPKSADSPAEASPVDAEAADAMPAAYQSPLPDGDMEEGKEEETNG